jgi:hypothetical protein
MPFSVRYVCFQGAKDGLLQVKIGRLRGKNDEKQMQKSYKLLINNALR